MTPEQWEERISNWWAEHKSILRSVHSRHVLVWFGISRAVIDLAKEKGGDIEGRSIIIWDTLSEHVNSRLCQVP